MSVKVDGAVEQTSYVTRAIHTGFEPCDGHQQALVPPLYLSTVYKLPEAEDKSVSAP